MVPKKDRDAAMKAIIEYKTNFPIRSITPDFLVYKGIADNKYAEEIVSVLESMDYIKCKIDPKDCFVKIELTPNGRHYFETQADQTAEEKRRNSHDWKIAVFSALTGALISEPLWIFIRFLLDFLQE